MLTLQFCDLTLPMLMGQSHTNWWKAHSFNTYSRYTAASVTVKTAGPVTSAFYGLD